jgi:glycerol-3-phosphate dehydrogenase
MQELRTEILVIGGGATGTGIVRDLAMRNFDAVLVEKGDLTQGTTGRYHGLLHSGGRYVVKDPQAARECIEENRILRSIMSQCIEDTSGFFVVTPWDNPDYAQKFVQGCRNSGIPVEDVPVAQMLAEERLLNPKITHCFRVPDASADSFLAANLNAISARDYGAKILNYHKVVGLIQSGTRVVGAQCHNLVKDEEITIIADLVVNATGAWAGVISRMAGIQVHIVPGKGTMIAANRRIVNTVINRCKMPSDGDILVPAHTVAVIGTTDVEVHDPDRFAIETWEVDLLLEEGEKIVPGFRDMRMLRAWAGVRPLYQETTVSDTRDVTRAFVLLDHQELDGVDGFVTITSGKWTTYRKMAEATVDLVCRKLGTQRICRTHLEPLPSHDEHKTHYLGTRLAEIENQTTYGHLICECELATYQDVAHAIQEGEAKSIDDIRRDTRLGMGPCQGGFCTFRAAGIMHQLRRTDAAKTNVALRDFLQERWKGLLPILWGSQLRQERLDELIYLNLLNIDQLPGPRTSRLSPNLYEEAEPVGEIPDATAIQDKPTPRLPGTDIGQQMDVLVIGAGLAGLSAAWQAASRSKSVRLIGKGWGRLYLHSGCIDVIGYLPNSQSTPVVSPSDAIDKIQRTNPKHPYSRIGTLQINNALEAFKELCHRVNYPLHGSIDRNWMLPTAAGAFRPTCLAPETMLAGDLHIDDPMLIVGFENYYDFYPQLIADNLTAQGIPATSLSLDLPEFNQQKFVNNNFLANQFDIPNFCLAVAEAIKLQLKSLRNTIGRIGFPAVLGIKHPIRNKEILEKALGVPVFEIPTLPPSIPGIRLSRILVDAIESRGGYVYNGMQALSCQNAPDNNRLIEVVWTEAAARYKPHRAKSFILATGGIMGGGLTAKYMGAGAGIIHEQIFNIPVSAPLKRQEWLHREFTSNTPQPIFRAGIKVNTDLQPVNHDNRAIYENLHVAGGTLAGGDYLFEHSLEGVSLASGYQVGIRA